MALSSSEEVDVRRLDAEMGAEIMSIAGLVKAINASQSCLPIVEVVRGRRLKASKISSIVDASHLVSLWEKYCIPYDIELLAPSLDERACYPKSRYIAISEFLLKA